MMRWIRYFLGFGLELGRFFYAQDTSSVLSVVGRARDPTHSSSRGKR